MNRVTYTVRHHYRYVYTSPIFDVRQRLIMIPPDRHADQVLLAFDLDVRGAQGQLAIDWQTDRFGNRVCRVDAERAAQALDFEARFTVRREAGPSPCVPHFEAGLSFTALTARDQRMQAAALDIATRASNPLERAELAHDWAARAITYQVGVTGTQTPASMALHLGRGVCQDYAHILLGVLRTLGIPCRYVSGHLLGEGPPHAWVEVLIDDAVVAYDPTHHRRVGLNYITVATGRDFADVTSTSGVFSGAATGKLHWSKQASILAEAAEAAA
ncbi:MAG TPA: transglutaminase family protein [Chloroflexota bacterium]|nr:transglutaminase family protein [Chloroflexota bacterium]